MIRVEGGELSTKKLAMPDCIGLKKSLISKAKYHSFLVLGNRSREVANEIFERSKWTWE